MTAGRVVDSEQSSVASPPRDDHERFEKALAGVEAPFALVDLDAIEPSGPPGCT